MFFFLTAHSFDEIPHLNWFSENLSGQGFHLTRESSREHDCLLVWSDAIDNSHHLIAKKGVKLSINRKKLLLQTGFAPNSRWLSIIIMITLFLTQIDSERVKTP